MATVAEIIAKTAKAVVNMDRLNRFVNGTVDETVSGDNGPYPTLANLARRVLGFDVVGTPVAGNYFVYNADGKLQPSTGTGNDPNLRTDLAAAGGDALVRRGDESLQTALDRADSTLSVLRNFASQNETWGSPDQVSFEDNFVGEVPIEGVRLVGGATAVIDATRTLQATSLYTDPAKLVVLSTARMAEGRFLVLVKRGATPADSTFMVQLPSSTGGSRATWSEDGTTLRYGSLQPDGSGGVTVTGYVLSNNSAFVGAAGDLVWVELETPCVFTGLTWRLRAWVFGGARPTDAAALSGVYGASANGKQFNEGAVALSSFPANPCRIVRVQCMDGRNGLPIDNKAAFIGRWTSRYDGGQLCKWTSRGGSRFRFWSTGTNDINIVFVVTPSGNPVVLDVFVNGVRRGSPVVLDGPTPGASNTKTLLQGLDAKALSEVEVYVRGVDVFSDTYYRGAGALLVDLVPTLVTGELAPRPDKRQKVLVIGDSTSHASVVRGTSANPLDYGGDVSWATQMANACDVQLVNNSFGGTGLTVGIDGATTPSAQQHAFNYMVGRPIDTEAENIKIILVNLGTNDKSRGVSSGDFKAAYQVFLANLLKRYPSVRKIGAMYPFGGPTGANVFNAEIFNAVHELQEPRVVEVVSNGAAGGSANFTDGTTHPNLAGHTQAGTFMTSVVRNMLASL